jgi:glycosyltransferase involved in cell wall biosynthesis
VHNAEGNDGQLLVTANEVAGPKLSIVIPALNEALATSEIALAKGARVLRTPKRGLGRAYIDAIPFIRGEYVLMGDADCTYDFRELGPFLESFHGGCEYVMGSRFRGYIEPGSMPPLHQYFGTPVTTWLLNFLYSSHFSDIHCGMRGITRDALCRMDLQSQS